MITNRHDTDNETQAGTGGHSRGSNQLGVRQYNERLILQLIRRAGSLPKAEIARMTNLSAQTVSVIINRLLNDKLLQKQARQREKGKVGQPSVPIALNPDGAYSIGVKIGRRSLDVLMIDFSGQVLQRLRHRYDYPDPDVLFPWIEQDIARLTERFTPDQHERIVGIGVVSPYSIGGWQQELGAPVKVLTRWSDIDIRQRIAARQPLPVWYANDATAACISELEFGKGARFSSYLYLFVGTFIGGGIVINGTLYTGAFDNAGALGSMPVPAIYAGSGNDAKNITTQLINCASRYLLDDRLRATGYDPDAVIEQFDQQQGDPLPDAIREIVVGWLQQTAAAIAFAVTTSISIVDFQGVIIDGALPQTLIEQLVIAIDAEMTGIDQEGLVRPQLLAGSIGNDARALGGAILPLYSNFAPDREVLLKLGVEAAG